MRKKIFNTLNKGCDYAMSAGSCATALGLGLMLITTSFRIAIMFAE